MGEAEFHMIWTILETIWPVVIPAMLAALTFLGRVLYRLEARMAAAESRIADVMKDREQDLLRFEKQRAEDMAASEKGRDLLRQEIVAMRAEVRDNLKIILERLK